MLRTKTFQQALEVVHSNVRIQEIIRERVTGRRASDGKSPAAVRAETATRYDQKTSTGWTEVLPWLHETTQIHSRTTYEYIVHYVCAAIV